MQRLLEEIEFRDPARARARWSSVAQRPARSHRSPASRSCWPRCPIRIRRCIIWSGCARKSPAGFRPHRQFAQRRCGYLITTFSYSHFLSEAILRHPEWLLQLTASGDLHRVLSAEEYGRTPGWHSCGVRRRAGAARSGALPPPADSAHRAARRAGPGTLSDVTEELSNLSDAILDLAYRRIREDLVARHGVPRYADLDGDAARVRILA